MSNVQKQGVNPKTSRTEGQHTGKTPETGKDKKVTADPGQGIERAKHTQGAQTSQPAKPLETFQATDLPKAPALPHEQAAQMKSLQKALRPIVDTYKKEVGQALQLSGNQRAQELKQARENMNAGIIRATNSVEIRDAKGKISQGVEKEKGLLDETNKFQGLTKLLVSSGAWSAEYKGQFEQLINKFVGGIKKAIGEEGTKAEDVQLVLGRLNKSKDAALSFDDRATVNSLLTEINDLLLSGIDLKKAMDNIGKSANIKGELERTMQGFDEIWQVFSDVQRSLATVEGLEEAAKANKEAAEKCLIVCLYLWFTVIGSIIAYALMNYYESQGKSEAESARIIRESMAPPPKNETEKLMEQAKDTPIDHRITF